MYDEEFDVFDDEIVDSRVENDPDYLTAPNNLRSTFWLYPLKSLIKGNKTRKDLVTFSPNTLEIMLVDPDDFQTFTGIWASANKLTYAQKQSLSNINGELSVYENFSDQITVRDDFTYATDSLYVISEAQLKTDDDIQSYAKFVANCSIPKDLTSIINAEKVFTVVNLDSWTTKDGNDIILRIGKQLDSLDASTISVVAPGTFCIDSLKMVAYDSNGNSGWAQINAKPDTQLWPIWMNPIESLASGEVNFLSYWTSSKVLDYNTLKTLIVGYDTTQNPPVQPQINLTSILTGNDVTQNGQRTQLNNVVGIEFSISGVSFDAIPYFNTLEQGPSDPIHVNFSTFPGPYAISYQAKQGMAFPLYPKPNAMDWTSNINNPANWTMGTDGLWSVFDQEGGGMNNGLKVFKAANSKFESMSDVWVTTAETFQYSSLINLLKDVLTATFNYNNNFKGAGYVNGVAANGLNAMALYKQRFEGKTIADYVDGLELQWEKQHPNLVNDPTHIYAKYKIVRQMLSHYIDGTQSIGGGGNNEHKILLPWYFNLTVRPRWTGTAGQEDDGSGIWSFREFLSVDKTVDLMVTVQSEYFNFVNNDIIPKNGLVSNKVNTLFSDIDFIWDSIGVTMEASQLPGILPVDLKLSDANVGKYLLYTSKKIESKYGTGPTAMKLSKTDFVQLTDNNAMTMKFDCSVFTQNPKQLVVSGIWGDGNWTLKIGSLELDNLPLFKENAQNIALTKVSL